MGEIIIKKILITTSSFAKYDNKPLEMIKTAGLSITLNPFGRKLNEYETINLISDADFLIAGTESLSRQVLQSANKLQIISRCGVGLDNIDLQVAKDMNIKVFNTPNGPTNAVAELTVALILSLLRKVPLMDSHLKKNIWLKKMGNLLYKKKIGIIGFGRIGQKVAKLLLPFDTVISYYDINKISHSLNCKPLDFKSLLSWADIISIHSSGSSTKTPVIGHRELKLMKPGSWLINLSRGGIVDENALYNALTEREIEGAAIDVYENEPYKGPLIECENIVLTPHVGSYARESRVEMEVQAVENLLNEIKD